MNRLTRISLALAVGCFAFECLTSGAALFSGSQLYAQDRRGGNRGGTPQTLPGGQPGSRPTWNQGGDRSRGRGDSSRNERRERQREAQRTAYRDKVIDQLKAMDTNKNGRLEPTESTPLSIAVFKKVGLNPSNSIGLSALTSTIGSADLTRMRIDKDAKVTGDNLEQGVPGFGVNSRVPQPPGSFEVTKHPALIDKRPLEERYTKEVIAQARSVLKSYDRNDNLMLDPAEIVLVPWGSPKPDDSDLDKNGFLTEIELCERLAKRSNGYISTQTEKKVEGRGEGREGRGRRGPAIPVAEVKKKARATMSEEDRTAKYVRGLITKYDKDSSSSLDSKEVEAMRTKPSPTADKDKDGNFTFEELYTHYSGGKKSSKLTKSRASSELPGTVFWDTPLIVGKKEVKSSSSRSSRSSRSRSSRKSSSGSSKVPTIKFGIK